ncbi:MAG: TOBE domain-containing protein [Phycisphaerales bacterium]
MQGSVLLGVRPWQVRFGAPRAPSIALDARVLAIEPAGLFADVIAVRADGRTLRARVSAVAAQELPIGEPARFHVHEEDVHLFASPWPGRRID